jgi:hypothetical protein
MGLTQIEWARCADWMVQRWRCAIGKIIWEIIDFGKIPEFIETVDGERWTGIVNH